MNRVVCGVAKRFRQRPIERSRGVGTWTYGYCWSTEIRRGVFTVVEEARFWTKAFEKAPKARLREEAEDIGNVGFVIAIVAKIDHTYCAGIGNGKTSPMSEGALDSWCSSPGLNWRPKSEGRQHLFQAEAPRVALWTQG
jgi:hypothetical protein